MYTEFRNCRVFVVDCFKLQGTPGQGGAVNASVALEHICIFVEKLGASPRCTKNMPGFAPGRMLREQHQCIRESLTFRSLRGAHEFHLNCLQSRKYCRFGLDFVTVCRV